MGMRKIQARPCFDTMVNVWSCILLRIAIEDRIGVGVVRKAVCDFSLAANVRTIT